MGGDADQGDHDSSALRDFYTDDLQLRSFVYLTIRSHRWSSLEFLGFRVASERRCAKVS